MFASWVENLWRNGFELSNGKADMRVVELDDRELRKEYNGARKLVLRKFSNAEVKAQEERMQRTVFCRMSPECRDMVCEPLRSAHPLIGIQIATKYDASVTIASQESRAYMQYLRDQLTKALDCLKATGCDMKKISLHDCIAIKHRPGRLTFNIPMELRVIDFVNGWAECGISLYVIEDLWNNPKNVVLGQGANGMAKLVNLTDPRLIERFAAKKLVLKMSNTKKGKRMEEFTHLTLYERMSRHCRRYICRPIKSVHPFISIQVAASQTDTAQVKTVDKLLGSMVHVRSEISKQLAKALMCIHSAGCLHNDFKLDNAIVLQEDNMPLRVKIIDFGLSECFKEHRHVLQREQMISAVRNGKRFDDINTYMLNYSWNGQGNFRNMHAVMPKFIDRSTARGEAIWKQLQYLHRGFRNKLNRSISEVYVNNMLSRNESAARVLQSGMKRVVKKSRASLAVRDARPEPNTSSRA